MLSTIEAITAIAHSPMEMVEGGQPMKDLGGAILDLSGGTYLISQPLIMPPGYANFNIQDGTLRASSSFPINQTLLLIGGGTIKGAGCLNIAVRRVTLDGGRIAGANLFVQNGQYVNIGPAVMVYGFNQYGIRMDGTGGGYIHQSWLGETPPSTFTGAGLTEINNLTATAISLEGSEHDCYVTDVIIWSALVGIKTKNGANTFTHVHPWNLMDSVGGIGFFLDSGSSNVSKACPHGVYMCTFTWDIDYQLLHRLYSPGGYRSEAASDYQHALSGQRQPCPRVQSQPYHS
eukprot:TRINITY_DN8057_c0_g1_i4.p1 TRINITY_DN8057_c0_g1~~TRINITY_DN8057_c0_g1_i4.p1  ORF type:complete len:289 (+),score=22.50 TRINITY_DN8057_c0_g1_i4:282-1148(+)